MSVISHPAPTRHRRRAAPPAAVPTRVELRGLPSVVAGGLTQLLTARPGRYVVAPRQAPGRPGLVLLDPHTALPADLVDVAGCPTVALVWGGGSHAHQRAKSLGVHHVLDIDRPAPDLLRALDDVVAGREPAPGPGVQVAGPGPGLLTQREGEVLVRVCAGWSNQEIAADLFLSINSIKTYVRTLYRKIGATRRSQAVIWGLANGY